MIRLLGNSLTAVAGNSLTAEDGQTYHAGPRVHKSHSYQTIGWAREAIDTRWMEFLNFCCLDSLNGTSRPPEVSVSIGKEAFHVGCELPSVSEDPGGKSKWIPQIMDLQMGKEKNIGTFTSHKTNYKTI